MNFKIKISKKEITKENTWIIRKVNFFYTTTIKIKKGWVECSPMIRETGVQSQVESYQRLKKMVLDAALLNTQHYKVTIKGQVEQSREWSSAIPYTLV